MLRRSIEERMEMVAMKRSASQISWGSEDLFEETKRRKEEEGIEPSSSLSSDDWLKPRDSPLGDLFEDQTGHFFIFDC
jgi:hypothetical protein